MDSIAALLGAMGATPDEVAGKLRTAGVRGLRDSTSFMNPVVRHVNRNLSVGGRMEVGAGGAVLRLHLGGKLREVPLPVAVQVFLDGFHRGLYPDLEAAPPSEAAGD
jgi:hypothetical protein